MLLRERHHVATRQDRKWTTVLLAVAVVVALAFGTSGCITNFGDTWPYGQKAPYMDTQMNPGWGGSHPTVCEDRPSSVAGREDYCHVLLGYEDGAGGWPDDAHNYFIDYSGGVLDDGPAAWQSFGTKQDQHPYYACPSGADLDPYGCRIVEPRLGWILSGCEYDRAQNFYGCDYRETYGKVMRTGGLDTINYLRATIDWAKYVKNAASCALSITKFVVDNPMLVACDDAVWNGPTPGGAEGIEAFGAAQTQIRTRQVVVQ